MAQERRAKYSEWPWNRPWLWLVLISATVPFLGLIWLQTGGCGQASGDVGFDTCQSAPFLGYPVTWALTAAAAAFLVWCAAGLARSVQYSRRPSRNRVFMEPPSQ
ncbi:hypothetical protein LN996_20005 [Arthrobacter sp. AK01]|uniref:hypothetical protein n=1 Tax=Micrococcaceae TaxID=1268 RepID=UPI001E4A11F4|nr:MULTISPECIES: hypothetical protein [Micrococcaceae]MCD4853109.1 hypothetical protein [Arthrobacter sp. AK01]MCP1411248.1 hypothetical protein [Paenarthrobacter sp. A20]